MAIDASTPVSDGAIVSSFNGTKISCVRYAGDAANGVDAFVTGTWDSKENKLTLWNVSYGSKSDRAHVIEKRHELAAAASISDVFIDETTVATALQNGSVEIYNLNENRLSAAKTFRQLHTRAESTAVCMLGGELICGSDNGSLVQVSLQGSSRPTKLTAGATSVQCLTKCSAYEVASGHGSGQIHLFDIRQKNAAPALTPMPLASQLAAGLNDSITSIDSQAAQPHVLAYGTRSGLVAFVDVRQYRQAPPNLLKVSQDAVVSMRFHPTFTNNCVALSEDACLHLQVSSSFADNEMEDCGHVETTSDGMANAWLTSSAWNTINLSSLISDEPKLLTACDLSSHTLLCGSDSGFLTALNSAFN